MRISFKTELKLNNKQRTLLSKHAGTARHAWNWGLGLYKELLDHNKENPEEKIKLPSAITLHKWLNKLVKPNNQWYYESSKCAPQFALRHLGTAINRCFKKVSAFPRFKKKGRDDSFTLDGTIKILHKAIQVPVIGIIKTYERLPEVEPKTVTISRKADRWFISFSYEIDIEPTDKLDEVVGVDLGLKALATLSNGQVINNVRSYKQAETKLKKLQRDVSRKVKGSNNKQKAITKLAKQHLRVANIRKDVLHKLTTQLAKNHSKVVIEDLNVSGMLANRKLAKAIADVGLYEFRRQLEYKCELYRSELVIVDRWFPSSKLCSNCGCKKETLSLSERVFNCNDCGFTLDRDLNAAINLSKVAS